jgi:sugar lactone lactonase YvrE
VSGSGSFQFATRLTSGSAYSVTVQSQPSSLPTLLCSVSKGSGQIDGADITDVLVSCASPAIALLAGRLGGSGNLDGQGSEARFDKPGGLAVDSDGTLYVVDGFGTVIRKISSGGLVTTIAGQSVVFGYGDGTGSAALFNGAGGLGANGADGVYVADSGNNVIRKVSSSGVVTTVAGQPGVVGALNGVGSAAQFYHPGGVVSDTTGNLYVGDYGNDTIRKITPDGSVTTFAGQPGDFGEGNGNLSVATFFNPGTLAIDSSGSLYISDTGNGVVRKIAGGTVSTVAMTSPGPLPEGYICGRLCGPYGIAVDSSGIYVSDFARDKVFLITPSGTLQTVAGSYNDPSGLAITPDGTLYVSDGVNSVIREVSPSGAFSTFAGALPSNGSADGPAAQARFSFPVGIVRDSHGNLFIADTGNFTIREISPGGTVSTFAGRAGANACLDGIGGAARFCGPTDIAIDVADNLYVVDSNLIRKVTPAAVVTTFAGNPSDKPCVSVDGTGEAASFCLPDGIALDSAGNLYVADNDTIRKITPAAVVTTFAGTAGVAGSVDGVGSAARFHGPAGLAVDSAGNIYVADNMNSTIRKITPGASVTTFAGTAGVSGSHDGTGSAATFVAPGGVTIDSAGNLYVTDGSTIRLISPSAVVTTIVGTPGSFGVRIGSLPGSLNVPQRIVLDSSSGSHLIVTDSGENSVLWITLQ